MKKSIVMFSALGVLLLNTGIVQAKEITFTGEKCPLTVSTMAEDAEEGMTNEVMNLKKIDVLGKVDPDTVAVIVKKKIGYVDATELAEKVPKFDLDTIPDASVWTMIEIGTIGDQVTEVQELMISLGILEGTADGQYGSGSAGAVSEFQTANGLAVNGNVDAETYLMLKSKESGEAGIELAYPPVFTVEEKFASICDYTDADLSEYLDPEWKFTYDVYDGYGELTKNELIADTKDTSSDVARIDIKIYKSMFLSKNEEGKVDVVPALKIYTAGASRPYIGNIQVRVGNDILEYPVASSYGELHGTTVIENAFIYLDEDLLSLIDGEVEFKINGQSRSYIVNK